MDLLKRLIGKKEPEPSSKPTWTSSTARSPVPPSDLLPYLPNYNPEPADGVRVGESPVPGLTLRRILRGHTRKVCRAAWSPDGRLLASPSEDKTIRIWDVARAECVAVLEGHEDAVYCVAWSPDGRKLASGSYDRTIRVWDMKTRATIQELRVHTASIGVVTWSPDGTIIISGSYDKTIRIWNLSKETEPRIIQQRGESKYAFAWSSDKRAFASISDNTICLWDINTWKEIITLKGHTSDVSDIIWSPDGNILASSSCDTTIRLWDASQGRLLRVLEGSPKEVGAISFSSDGRLLASKTLEEAVRLWRCDTWETIAQFVERQTDTYPTACAFHPTLPILVTLGDIRGTAIRIWEIDTDLLLGLAPSSRGASRQSVNYTTAKLVLVGDSGVGKTGLGWRLAHNEFKEHSSTHGQQFWVIPQLGKKRDDGTQCEAVLWDLAGQHVYRQIHSIFLENVATAFVLFDPSNRQEPLKGVEFWLEQLKGKKQLPPSVLVGARVDRGAPALSQQELDRFCQRYGVKGGYISTSAKTGEGVEQLLQIVKAGIPWDEMTATVTTVTFKRIKDYVMGLKEQPERTSVLVSPDDLRDQLHTTDKEWEFTDAEMMTAVGHLETHGYVAVLSTSAGEQEILLAPELLVNLAASIVLLADKNPRELGAVSETELLQGRYPFDDLKGLDEAEQQILLDAAVLRFLEHNICFRETFKNDTLLIFPSLIKQKRPLQDDLPAIDDISYVVRGRVENLYAMLVVLLGYSPSFARINQWQNQAQYEMGAGEICGFRAIEEREGEIELVLYYGDQLPESGRNKFQQLFEQFLYQRDVQVSRFPPVVCPEGHRQERATVIKRVRDGKRQMHCDECGSKITLPDFDEPQTIGIGASPWLQREEATARLRTTYEMQLSRVKGYRRAWAAPRCYVSCSPKQAAWAQKLVHDLRDAGVFVVEQAGQVQPDDFVVLLETPAYRQAFESSQSAIAADVQLIRKRLAAGDKNRVIAIACSGTAAAHTSRDCRPGDFCDQTHYPVSLFDLVLNLYAIPLTHAGFEPLRESLHQKWEQTLARFADETKNLIPKIFVSYSHQDEKFKNELDKMLAGLQRRGVIDMWQDRRIEPGEQWFNAIKQAIDQSDMALLLISGDFIASRFINDEELPDLLNRRQEEGMIVIPIIIRDCLWQSEPVLKDLQALPIDGKAVITFSEATGERDRIWTEIAQAIENRAKAMTMP